METEDECGGGKKTKEKGIFFKTSHFSVPRAIFEEKQEKVVSTGPCFL